MNHVRGVDREQTLLLPETIEDYVAPENPVRFLDALVASLDLHALGFARAIAAYTGRPAYDPGTLLRLYLYGYLHRLRSSRQLEKECQRNLELIWLLRRLVPDHKTIADFRRDHRASAGARLAEYLQQLDAGDTAEAQEEKLTRPQLEEKIAALREKKEWHDELRAQLQDGEEKQLSTTDEDARKRHAAQGTLIGDNAQSAVDAKHKLIVAQDVTNEGTDVQQLAAVAGRRRKRWAWRASKSWPIPVTTTTPT
jgi:transposase